MLKSYRTRYVRAWNNLRREAKLIIGFEIWFTLIYVAALAPFTSWLLNKLLASSGRLAVTNEEIISFFITPLGVLFVLLSFAVFLALAYLERVGLMIIGVAAFRQQVISVSRLLWLIFTRFLSIVQLGLLQAALYIAVSFPFAGLGFLTYHTFLREHDITYYLVVKPGEWRAALVIGGVIAILNLLVIGYLCLRWLFSIPILIFENKKPWVAMKESGQHMRSHIFKLGIPLAVWLLAVLLTAAITTGALKMIFASVLAHAGLKLAYVLPLVILALALMGLSAVVYLIAGNGGHIFLIVDFYLETAPDKIKIFEKERALKKSSPSALSRIVWISACLLLALNLIGESIQLENLNFNREIAVTAHRGSSYDAPENTMSALRQAVADGAEFAEIDVQTTADGVVILMHDRDLMRFASLNRWIRDMEYADLLDIDIGSWFSEDFSHERVAKLEEAMEYAAGRIRLNIELKYNWRDPLLIEKVGSIIRESSFTDKCVVTTTDYTRFQEFRRLFPEVRSGPVILHALGNFNRIEADFLSMGAAKVTPRLIRQAHRKGQEIHVWTVNDLQTALAMVELGVDNIITDRPTFIRRVINTWNEFSTTQKVALWLRNLILDVDPSLIEEL